MFRRTSERFNSESPAVYKLNLERKVGTDSWQRFDFGGQSFKKNRRIILFGVIGSEKSTLKINDQLRSLRSQSHSQMSEVTVYKINHQEGFKIEYSLTIIDTPDFGSTRGIKRDKLITEQLQDLFHANDGVTEIDAVNFTKYVFDSVLSIFGKDVAENIRILVTFADGQQPPVLEAIKASGVPYPTTDDGLPVHFKFNNSALFADNKPSAANRTADDEDSGGFDEMFWNMGTKSMERLFAALNGIQSKGLTLTKKVLKERQQLEDSVEDLQKKVKLELAKLEEKNETTKKLKEAEMNRNEKFEIKVTIIKPFEEDISGHGSYSTNCQQCHYTGHYPCPIADDRDKIHCAAMSDGYYTQCPNKCPWDVHFNQNEILVHFSKI
uniref:AIG1-type G domain-containing protein n=1 Tax=Stegastes partitus TaxID=144197 RepID=A0A3B4ZZR8_9TELE